MLQNIITATLTIFTFVSFITERILNLFLVIPIKAPILSFLAVGSSQGMKYGFEGLVRFD